MPNQKEPEQSGAIPIPRNAYARELARRACALRLRAARCGGVRVNGGEWLIDDRDNLVERIAGLEAAAHRWSRVPWCSIVVGDFIETGGLSAKAVAARVLLWAVWPMLVLGIGVAVYLLMALGAAVLPGGGT